MLENIKSSEICLEKIKNNKKNSNLNYLLTNMRMSICELG
jgi:predicted RNA-binding protein with PUA-like domain